MTVTALLTCFNRRAKTLACLSAMKQLSLPHGVKLKMVVVDDGSGDGTASAVREQFPETELLSGDGNLYWCGGMRKAWKHASESDPDYYLLVNDDTVLRHEALLQMIDICGDPEVRRIVVGAVADPETGRVIYGGRMRKTGGFEVDGTARLCDTFNANCALVPRGVFRELGVFHEAYTHGMGDYDYGFSATRRGIDIVQTPGIVACCEPNTTLGSWRDRRLTRRERLRRLQSPKGLPWKEWLTYNRRNQGWKWPWYAVSPFLRILAGR